MKNELQSIISGESQVKHGAIIQAAARYLKGSQRTGKMAEVREHFKKEEREYLDYFISEHDLWITTIDLNNYVSEGSEQKVYLKDGNNVIKLSFLCSFDEGEITLHK